MDSIMGGGQMSNKPLNKFSRKKFKYKQTRKMKAGSSRRLKTEHLTYSWTETTKLRCAHPSCTHDVCVWTLAPLSPMLRDLHYGACQELAERCTMTNGRTAVMTCLKPREICLRSKSLFRPSVSGLTRRNHGMVLAVILDNATWIYWERGHMLTITGTLLRAHSKLV